MAFQLFPSFSFDESDVGLRPVRPAGLDRIAIVGEFARGPLTPTITNFNDFSVLFSKTLHPGSIGVQAANLQGADDFLIARVTNPGVRASLSTTVTGTASATGTLTVTVNTGTAYPLPVTVTSGDSAVAVATSIRNAVNAAGIDVEAIEGTTPSIVIFRAKNYGTAANAFTVQITGSVAGTTLTPSLASATVLASGSLGAVTASKTFTTAPTGTVTLSGPSFTTSDTITISVNGVTVVTTLGAGDISTLTTVATAVVNNLNASTAFSAIATASSSAAVITITSRTGNAYSLVASDTSTNGVVTASGGNLVGQSVFKVEAISPGSWGNSIAVTVTQGSTPTLVNVNVSLPAEAISETVADLNYSDLYDQDKFSQFRSSSLVRVTLLDATKVAAPIASSTLTSGSDGPTVTTQDYIDAIDRLRDYYCTFVIAPGIKDSSISQASIDNALVAHAEYVFNTLGEEAGLRVAILSAPRGMAIADLAALKAANRIPNSKHAVMVAGWGTLSTQPRLRRYGCSPDAVMAGHLVSTPFQVSAAARTSSPFIQGILEVDTPKGIAAFNEITKARLDALILDTATGGIHCLNGRTTSSDSAWYWSCFRRVYNKIRMDLYFGYQFIKSEPSDLRLDTVVQDTGNSYLSTQLELGLVNGYNPVISNDSNNKPETRAAGIRFIDFGIEMKYPSDFIGIRISRVLTGQIRLGGN